MIDILSQTPQTAKAKTMYGIDPPMKHQVAITKAFPGAFI